MWAALLGAVVGGVFALTGGFSIELRRDRRRQLAAARLIVAEFSRSAIEVDATAAAASLLVGQMYPSEDAPHIEGLNPDISAGAWLTNAPEFIGRLSEADFNFIERTAILIRSAGKYGFGADDAKDLGDALGRCREILEPLTRPTWFDRHIWRL